MAAQRFLIWVAAALSAALSAADSVPSASGAALAVDALRIGGRPVYADRLILRGVEFTSVTARLVITEGQLRFEDMQAQAYGGTASGTASIDLTNSTVLMDMHIHDASLAQFLRRFGGWEQPAFDGRIDGRLRLELPDSMATRLSGRGDVTVRDGSLVSVPALAEWFLGRPWGEAGADHLRARLLLTPDRVVISDSYASGRSADVSGRGFITYRGVVEVVVQPSTRGVTSGIPLLGPAIDTVVGTFTRRLGRLRIDGTVGEPVVNYAPWFW
jgi:hypothetical protein